MNTSRWTGALRRPLIVMMAAAAVTAPSTAHAQDLSAILGSLVNITGLLTNGGLMGLVSMIPGLNFLAGIGPIMDIVKMIPGLGGLLSSIPGLDQILNLIGGVGGGGGPRPPDAPTREDKHLDPQSHLGNLMSAFSLKKKKKHVLNHI